MTFRLVVIGVLLLALLAGGASFYYQQQTANLANQVNSLTSNLGTSNTEVDRLRTRTSDLHNQNDQLQTVLNQLVSSNKDFTDEIAQLESQIHHLNSTLSRESPPAVQTEIVSQGQVNLSGYGRTVYIPFSVPSNISRAQLRLAFSVSGGYAAKAVLLSQDEQYVFSRCNCVFNGNYTSTTWISPSTRSYNTTLTIPFSGSWFLGFIEDIGTGSGLTITETSVLAIYPSHGWTAESASTGTIQVAFMGISYVSFTVYSLPATMNVTFGITNFNGYYPQSVGLYLLTLDQYHMFLNGNYTSSTWSYPYATGLGMTRVQMPFTGTWYLAFQEQDPNGGFPASVAYAVRLIVSTNQV